MLNPPRHIARLFEAIGKVLWRHKWKLAFTCTMLAAVWLTWEATVWECGGDDKHARIEAGQLSQMVDAYYLQSDPHQLPEHLDNLNDMNLVKGGQIPNDPWGTPYMYVTFSDRDFRIVSAGPDQMFGTTDDITDRDFGRQHRSENTPENTRRLRL
jgi:hypothetical protein